MSDFRHYSQMSMAELKAKAEKSAREAGKKGKKLEPVLVEGRGRELSHSWWGKAWCANLERYADYANRIDRGKRYVRSGAIVDLKMSKGKVIAKVQGSRRTPYTVTIHIDPLSEKRIQEILSLCTRKASSLESLANGEFPEELKSVFMKEGGLFPSPKEIHFDCSCPDWASMCKHVASVMYGIGVRLDQNPFCFFELRGIDTSDLIRKSVANKVEALLENAGSRSDRYLSEEQAFDLFSLD